ncbi:hypothetical protein GGI07_003080 [Coemansia sp. Benny D115]|nr:hypothetical protein GGI07_003080 [Coemansia sp. Benny D115]
MRGTVVMKWTRCVLAVSYLVLASGCGPAVHNEAIERARQWFRHVSVGGGEQGDRMRRHYNILERQVSSLQAGAVFPDWGYGCLSMDDPAEAAHWTPFLEYGTEYFLSTYPAPYTAQGERLLAFLFGVASHQVADEQWHSLSGLREGFMVALANSTFDGDYPRAHDVLDVGGDFTLAHMSGLEHILNRWEVPVDDVLAIYESMGISVSRWKMSMCLTRQLYAMEAVRRFGSSLFPSYASRAPMLTERLEDYYIGGLYAMATATTECWMGLMEWFDFGDFSKKCLISDRRHRRHGRHPVHRSPANAILDHLWPREQWERSLEDSAAAMQGNGTLVLDTKALSFPEIPELHGLEQSYEKGGRQGQRQHVFVHQEPQRQPQTSSKSTFTKDCADLSELYPRIKQLYTASAYSGFGTAVVTGNFNGKGAQSSVAISAPYHTHADGGVAGAVFVLESPHAEHSFSQQQIDDADPLVLRPANATGHQGKFPLFGASLAVVDYNADGIDDLVVGSSAHGTYPTGKLLGCVDIYLGHAGSGLSSTPDFTLTAEQLAKHTDSPFAYQRIGGFLFGTDVNGDGFADLLIGAPYHSDVPYETHAGRLFAYVSAEQYSSPQRPGGEMGPPSFTLVSPQRQAFEWFGFAAQTVSLLDTNTTVLLVGAPGSKYSDPTQPTSHALVGTIYAFAAEADQQSPRPLDLRFVGLVDNAQLGSHIHVWPQSTADKPARVLFGSPSEHSSAAAAAAAAANYSEERPPAPARGWQAGQVRVLDSSQWVLENSTDDPDSMSGLLDTLHGMQSPGHFGRAMAADSAGFLWIGEPFGAAEDGRIHRWREKLEEPECFSLLNPGMRRARLGHNIAVARGPSGSDMLVVGALHDSQFSRLGGSVVVMQRD